MYAMITDPVILLLNVILEPPFRFRDGDCLILLVSAYDVQASLPSSPINGFFCVGSSFGECV